jgi:hypothetical protein
MERLMETLESNNLKEENRFALYKLADATNNQGNQEKYDEA